MPSLTPASHIQFEPAKSSRHGDEPLTLKRMTSIHDSLELEDIRATLSGTPAVLRSLLTMAPEGALSFHEAPDTWNPFEVLCHVTDAELYAWLPRVAIIMSADGDRRFTPFDREAGFSHYRGWTLDALLREFERLRADNLDRLAQFNLSAADLARTGIHPEFGPVTLRQLLACWVTHDLAHVTQIARVLVRCVGRDVGPWRAYFSLLR
jgi:DinB superfamily